MTKDNANANLNLHGPLLNAGVHRLAGDTLVQQIDIGQLGGSFCVSFFLTEEETETLLEQLRKGLEAVRQAIVPAPPALVPPELATLLGDDALDAEVEAEVRDRLAADDPFDVVAAVGMIVRHKRPATRSLEAILAAKDAPTALERARAWWADRTDHHDAVLATALDEVDRLRDGLSVVRDAVAHESRAREIAQAWLRSRDDLAGVATILESAPLNEAVNGLDDALRAAADPFLDIDGLDTDRRLSIATWTDPSAIWTWLIREDHPDRGPARGARGARGTSA